MFKSNTYAVTKPIADGAYEVKLSSFSDGKTLNDTRIDFEIVSEGEFKGRKLITFTNNSKVIWTDADGRGWTSEDFFFAGIARQVSDENIDTDAIVELLQNGTVITVYVAHNDSYQNVTTSKPKAVEDKEILEDLGL